MRKLVLTFSMVGASTPFSAFAADNLTNSSLSNVKLWIQVKLCPYEILRGIAPANVELGKEALPTLSR
jgi:hypothetical protein